MVAVGKGVEPLKSTTLLEFWEAVRACCDGSVRKRVPAHENLKMTGINRQFEVEKILYIDDSYGVLYI